MAQTYNNEVYKSWTPVYRAREAQKNSSAVSAESGMRFQSGLKQQVVQWEEELERELPERELSPKVGFHVIASDLKL